MITIYEYTKEINTTKLQLVWQFRQGDQINKSRKYFGNTEKETVHEWYKETSIGKPKVSITKMKQTIDSFKNWYYVITNFPRAVHSHKNVVKLNSKNNKNNSGLLAFK